MNMKFFELLDKSLTRPKKRIKTKPTKASNLRRLEKKKIIHEKNNCVNHRRYKKRYSKT